MAKRRTKKRAGRRRKARRGTKRRGTKRRKGGGSKLVCPKTVGGKRVTASKGRCWIITKTPVQKVPRKGSLSAQRKKLLGPCAAKKYAALRAKGVPAQPAARQAKAAC